MGRGVIAKNDGKTVYIKPKGAKMKVTIPMVITLVSALNERAEIECSGSHYPLIVQIAPLSKGSHFRILFMGNDLYNSMDSDPGEPDSLEAISKEILEELGDIRQFLNDIIKH